MLPERDLKQHLLECLYRLVVCQYCSEEVPFSGLEVRNRRGREEDRGRRSETEGEGGRSERGERRREGVGRLERERGGKGREEEGQRERTRKGRDGIVVACCRITILSVWSFQFLVMKNCVTLNTQEKRY
jgi:hypothetical protein